MYNSLGRVPADASVNAGFWRRCAAQLLDGLILLPVTSTVALILAFAPAMIGLRDAATAHTVSYAVVLAINWLYFALQESSAAQASLGKRAFALKVVDERIERIGFGRATFRYFAKFASALILGVGFAMAGFSRRKRALHDMLAGTFVVFGDVFPGESRPTVRPRMPWYGWLLNASVLVYPIIVVAITVPAYNAYTDRAQVSEGMVASDESRIAIVTFYASNDRCPDSPSEAGFDSSTQPSYRYVRDVTIKPNCVVSVTYASEDSVASSVRGGRLDLTGKPDANGIFHWACGGTLPSSLLPYSCRN